MAKDATITYGLFCFTASTSDLLEEHFVIGDFVMALDARPQKLQHFNLKCEDCNKLGSLRLNDDLVSLRIETQTLRNLNGAANLQELIWDSFSFFCPGRCFPMLTDKHNLSFLSVPGKWFYLLGPCKFVRTLRMHTETQEGLDELASELVMRLEGWHCLERIIFTNVTQPPKCANFLQLPKLKEICCLFDNNLKTSQNPLFASSQ
jgi:hypothetical protein